MTSRPASLGTRQDPTGTIAPSRLALLLAFFAIYVVWGSTYLAIRYAVETIPPLVVAGLRHIVAGLFLLSWAYLRGYRPTAREWRASVVLGFLYFVLGHGSLHWAETVVPSGWAALLIASEPIWIAVMAALVTHGERLTGKTVMGLLLGIAGVGLLVGEVTLSGQHSMVLGSLAILLGTLAWSVGVMYSLKAPLPRNALARAGMPEIVGSLMLLLLAGVTGEYFAVSSGGRHAPLMAFAGVSDYLWLHHHLYGLYLAT